MELWPIVIILYITAVLKALLLANNKDYRGKFWYIQPFFLPTLILFSEFMNVIFNVYIVPYAVAIGLIMEFVFFVIRKIKLG